MKGIDYSLPTFALVKKNFRIHYGTGLGVPQDIDAALGKREQRRIAVISDYFFELSERQQQHVEIDE